MKNTLYTAYRKRAMGGQLGEMEMDIPPVIGGGPRGGGSSPMPEGMSKANTNNGSLGKSILGNGAEGSGSASKTNWAGIANAGSGIINGVVENVSRKDPLTGRSSVGSHVVKGASSGAAAGTQILPGWGTLIGAVVGAAAGWIGGGAAKRKARAAQSEQVWSNTAQDASYSNSLVAGNPSLVSGNRNASYYANGGAMTKFANTGTEMNAPLARMFMNGGSAKPLSSTNTELVGRSHSNGGIDIPELNTEVEGGETTNGNYVFSKKLGFAELHKPIAKAKGVIETKPATAERINALQLLGKKEQDLALAQEYLKKKLKVA